MPRIEMRWGRLRAPLFCGMMVCAAAAGRAQEHIGLSLPVDCVLGDSCYIQQYVDRDPGPGVEDFACGALANDGHRGTDFAIATEEDMARGVAVVAAAPGTVIGTRDELPDIRQGSPDAPDVSGRECGNGVSIVHGGGWRTQYCHLREGSVLVSAGDVVEVGAPLGLVGMSGDASFPHLHMSVRRDGEVVDPFLPQGEIACGKQAGQLWSPPLAYDPGGLIGAGLIDRLPEYSEVQAGLPEDGLTPSPGAVVIWAYLANGRAGDVVRFELTGPDGPYGNHDEVLERNQPLLFRAWGHRAPDAGLAPGAWRAAITLFRDEAILDREEVNGIVR